MAAPNVVQCRPLVRGVRGADVVAHKRAVSRAMPHVYPWASFSSVFGDVFEDAVVTFQKAHGIPHSGRIGKTTHEVLERTRNHAKDGWAFDSVAIKAARDFCEDFVKTPEERVREAIVDAAYFWYAHRLSIRYSQRRPFDLGRPPWVPGEWDCSGFATGCHFAGGAPDPNGRSYDHQGYTGTLMDRGHRVSKVEDLELGDLIFYGYTTRRSPAFPVGSPTHVAVYVGLVRDSRGVLRHSVISNGHYPMGLYRYDYRPINHLRTYDVVAL